MKSDDNRVWLGTRDGIVIINPDGTNTSIRRIHDTELHTVTAINQDKQHCIWIGSGSSFEGAFRWDGATWKLKEVTLTTIESNSTVRLPERDFTGIESPSIFREDIWKVEEMTILELMAYQRRLKEAGFKNIKFTVDISSRLSYPLINFFMLLIGIALSYILVRKRIPMRRVLEFLALLGFAVPGTVMGVGYILSFNSPPLKLTGTFAIMVINEAFRNLSVQVFPSSSASPKPEVIINTPLTFFAAHSSRASEHGCDR
jgi:lipopolysaccharide export LptBFGC system permease protein LptF